MATSANFAGDASLPLPLVLGSAGPALPSGCGTIGDRMSALVRLRPWQKAALERFAACDRPDFLAVATPGAGKTTFALTAALSDLATHPRRRIVVVAPTHHLKTQWARAAAAFGLHLEPAWSPRGGRLPADMHGVVVTYQQMAADPGSLRAVTRDAFVVFDEVHHAGEDRAWGDGLRHAFEPAARRLSISGTPFRSDTQAIPFVDYVGDEAVPDYTYGYADALRDGGVVRPAYFPRVDGEMEWTAADGSHHSSTFADALDHAGANQRLRTALSVGGEWLPAVLDQAHGQLRAIRRVQPDAGGLVIAMDTEHARGVAALLRRRLGVSAVVATSEDVAASARISRFADSRDPWIVAVRMVSEGVDIPRLRVGVYATNTTTELFFRQAVGRLVRWTRGMRAQKAFMFIPDDVRLRQHAAGIGEDRRHSLRRRDDEDDASPEDLLAEIAAGQVQDEQLSLFAAISARPLGDPHLPEWEVEEAVEADDGALETEDDLEFVLAAPPPLTGGGQKDAGAAGGMATPHPPAQSRTEHKRRLRASNADRARTISLLTGLGHAKVNGELNRLTGIRTISEATVDQLERRLNQAERWIRKL